MPPDIWRATCLQLNRTVSTVGYDGRYAMATDDFLPDCLVYTIDPYITDYFEEE